MCRGGGGEKGRRRRDEGERKWREREGEVEGERKRSGRIWREARKTMMREGERDTEKDEEGERWRERGRGRERGKIQRRKKEEQKEEREYHFKYLFPCSLSLTIFSPPFPSVSPLLISLLTPSCQPLIPFHFLCLCYLLIFCLNVCPFSLSLHKPSLGVCALFFPSQSLA